MQKHAVESLQLKKKRSDMEPDGAGPWTLIVSPLQTHTVSSVPAPRLAWLGSAVCSCRVDTMVDLLEMERLKLLGTLEQRLASLEEQVGSGPGLLFLGRGSQCVAWWL